MAFIDQGKHGWFVGKEVVKVDRIKQYAYNKILVMIQDIQECINVVRTLIAHEIFYKYILIGYSLYGDYSKWLKEISVLPNGNLIVAYGNVEREVSSVDDFNDFFNLLNGHKKISDNKMG